MEVHFETLIAIIINNELREIMNGGEMSERESSGFEAPRMIHSAVLVCLAHIREKKMNRVTPSEMRLLPMESVIFGPRKAAHLLPHPGRPNSVN